MRIVAIASLTFLCATGLPSRAQEPAATREVAAAANAPQRINDLFALIEGPNSAPARRTGARELLRQPTPETIGRLVSILAGSNTPARVAVAAALADAPAPPDPAFVEPLLGMLNDADAELRRAAAAALAAYRDASVVARLRALSTGAQVPLSTRLAAIDALGLMPQREAVAALFEVISDRASPLSRPALAAVENAVALDFRGDPVAALEWWSGVRDLPDRDWNQLQSDRLMRQNREVAQQLRDVELRLLKALRERFFRIAEAERGALLAGYLADSLRAVRLLGLELVQSQLTEGKSLAPELTLTIRALTGEPDPAIRAAAVRTVAALRDPADADRFLQLLSAERNEDVRVALVNGLGHVGGDSVAPALLECITDTSPAIQLEAVSAIGRLAERGVLEAATRPRVSSVLQRTYQQPAAREQVSMRERLLWAMSRVADPGFAASFTAALDSSEPPTIRLAAVRGLTILAEPPNGDAAAGNGPPDRAPAVATLNRAALLDALAATTRDPDVGVRRAAVEALAALGRGEAHLQALWNRTQRAIESDEGIRDSAWNGVLAALATRPAADVLAWAERIPVADDSRAGQHLELLLLAEKSLQSSGNARGELGRVRARIAALRARLNQPAEAVDAYLVAVADLQAAQSPELPAVAIEVLRLALVNQRLDQSLATMLAEIRPPLDGEALAQALRAEIESRIHPEGVDRALQMLTDLRTVQPLLLPASFAAEIESLAARARALRAAEDSRRVDAAVTRLTTDPADAAARGAITELGERSIAPLCATLRRVLTAETPDPVLETLLCELLKTVSTWPGFAGDAAPADKLTAIDQLCGT